MKILYTHTLQTHFWFSFVCSHLQTCQYGGPLGIWWKGPWTGGAAETFGLWKEGADISGGATHLAHNCKNEIKNSSYRDKSQLKLTNSSFKTHHRKRTRALIDAHQKQKKRTLARFVIVLSLMKICYHFLSLFYNSKIIVSSPGCSSLVFPPEFKPLPFRLVSSPVPAEASNWTASPSSYSVCE